MWFDKLTTMHPYFRFYYERLLVGIVLLVIMLLIRGIARMLG